MMDIIISLVLVFAYYLYTRFDKESKELDKTKILHHPQDFTNLMCSSY